MAKFLNPFRRVRGSSSPWSRGLAGLVSVSFTLAHEPGALKRVLDILAEEDVNISKIESRPSIQGKNFYDVVIESEEEASETQAQESRSAGEDVATLLRRRGFTVTALRREPLESTLPPSKDDVPWFPRRLRDLDAFADHVLSYGAQLEADHPGFTDKNYRRRRESIAEKAKQFRTGDPLPTVEYTEDEHQTWSKVYREMEQLRSQYACEQVRHIFPLLERDCGFGPERIPQLNEVSAFMKDCSGFTLRPVMGLMSPRDFLNGLAFRVFHSTQYIRHSSTPLYTPEPDVCHELLGHVPMLCDPEFAAFSQEIGLASLAVSDADIEKLAKCYWFSVEFGLCKEANGTMKAYGAGLLSSTGEIRHAMGERAEFLEWDPAKASQNPYPITEYQPLYFVAEDFPDATEKLRAFAQSLKRPFSVYYNPFTQSVQILDTNRKLAHMASDIRRDIGVLSAALSRKMK